MGCDGGTIPRRDELVRLKKKPEQKDKDAELAAKWKHCAITQEPLRPPIVACELGRLYNKESVLEFLLDKSKFESAANFEHIRGLKDVHELKLTENSAYQHDGAEKGDGYVDRSAAQYICPITGLEMSGRYKFMYLLGCNCVFSERAIKEVKSETCNKCGRGYTSADIVVLNGSDDEVAQLRHSMEERRLKAKMEKKSKKKHKAEAAAGSAAALSNPIDGASAAKQPRLDTPDEPSTSKAASTKTDVPSTSSTGIKSKLTASSKAGSKLSKGTASGTEKATNGKSGTEEKEKKYKSIQNDPNASKAYKSLFNTCDKAKNQQQPHWITHNPLFY